MIRYSDMDDNMKKEVMDVCTTACERHTANNELVGDACMSSYNRYLVFLNNFSVRKRLKRSSTRNSEPVGMWWWVRDLDLSSVMK